MHYLMKPERKSRYYFHIIAEEVEANSDIVSGGERKGMAVFRVPVHEAKRCSQSLRPRFALSPWECQVLGNLD